MPHPPPTPRPIAVFDLDGTLVRGDSFTHFTRALLRRSPWRAVAATLCVPILAPLYALHPTRRRAFALLLRIATIGLPPYRFAALATEFATERTSDGNRIPHTLDRARAHLAAGDRVVIATSCAEPLAAAICHELGLAPVDVIASRLTASRTGMRPLPACRGVRKVERIRAAGITGPITHAYTDSSVDLPLLNAAAHRYLIDPSPAHLTRIHTHLGPTYVVLRSTEPTTPSAPSEASSP
ncbi:haloacid dehalogenase-like hydrolase [Embleya sp. NPDC020630]|uniref:haloacid dehalogenase-like hydrolase n=1 Tax=Embleya sp. NPDC020630 TaxID=3363979 RepID=UPI00378DA70D